MGADLTPARRDQDCHVCTGVRVPGSAAGRTLFEDVNDTLAQLGGVSWQAWEYTTIFPRDSQFISTLGTQLGLTDAQLDQMFIAAAALGV